MSSPPDTLVPIDRWCSDQAEGDDESRPQFRPPAPRGGDARHDFEDECAGRKQPYYMRGDARYDTPAGLKKRMKLLESGKVARAARQFWDALELHGDDAAMSYDDYSKVHPNLNPQPPPQPQQAPAPTAPSLTLTTTAAVRFFRCTCASRTCSRPT